MEKKTKITIKIWNAFKMNEVVVFKFDDWSSFHELLISFLWDKNKVDSLL